MLVDIHKEDKRGNVYTMREPGGLGIVWRGKCFLVPYGFESDGASGAGIHQRYAGRRRHLQRGRFDKDIQYVEWRAKRESSFLSSA